MIMALLTEREHKTLIAICETFIPQLETTNTVAKPLYDYTANDSDVASRLEEAYEKILSEEELRDIKQFLNLLAVGAVNGMTAGVWRNFNKMSIDQRTKVLAAWGTSKFELQRKAFQGIKRLALFLAYAPLDNQRQPLWDVVNYPPLPQIDNTEPAIQPTDITGQQVVMTEVLIIGSGAGGGVVAGELAAAGYEVMVVEKGGYHAEHNLTGNELTESERLFEKNGALTTKNTAMIVLAGATLGGGTTVNWSASFRTPKHVLREWANEYGIREAISDSWQQSLDAVMERTNVNCDESHVNPNNGVFERGLKNLGWHVDTISRNVKGCEDCTFCNYGCTFGAKQGTLKTYLQDAYDQGSNIVVNATVRRILHERGEATGAIVEVTDDHGNIRSMTIKAKLVVVAAGSIHTPAILLRSGLTNPHIGGNLHLHPTTLMYSLFPEAIRPWQGVPMSRVSKQFSNLDGRGYGVTLEVAPSHIGLSAATIGWTNAKQHKSILSNMERMANVIAIARDYYGGRVVVDRYGDPVLDYQLHPYDEKHLQRGVLEMLKIHYAAGAEEVFAPHNDILSFKRTGNDGDFVRFLRQVEDRGLQPNAFPLFSAHQMSSCRMAGSPRQGALKPSGETYEVKNLFVADGSAMPTATGVNPMMSIMATAHHIAQHIKIALG